MKSTALGLAGCKGAGRIGNLAFEEEIDAMAGWVVDWLGVLVLVSVLRELNSLYFLQRAFVTYSVFQGKTARLETD